MKFMWGEGAKGLLVGAGLGAPAGFGAAAWLIEGNFLDTGLTVLASAGACGAAGFLWGDSFFDWLKDCWHWILGAV